MGNLYVTINERESQPWEVFLNVQKSGKDGHANAEALGRLIDLNLQAGVELTQVRNQLRAIEKTESQEASLANGIAEAIENYLEEKADGI